MTSTQKRIKLNSDFNHILWFFLLLGAYLFAPSILATIYATALKVEMNSAEFETIAIFAQAAGLFPVLALALYFSRHLFIEDWQKTKKRILYTILFIVAGAIAVWLLTTIVNIFYGLICIEGTSENQESLESAVLSKYGLIMLIPIVFFAPIIEELIFRKFIFGIIEEKLKWSPWSAILISTVIFSVMHLLSGDFQYILLYLPQAFVMGMMYHFSKNNIFVPITIHFINNLLAAIGILVLRGLA